MKVRDKHARALALVENLLAVPPLRLPGLTVYLVSESNAQAFSLQLQDRLAPDDKASVKRFATSALRRRFITARNALRCILSMAVGGTVSETDWRFASSANGKPYIRSPMSPVYSFNISYAENIIAIAVSKTMEVGVDIETSHEIPESDLPWHLFSHNEIQQLQATPAIDFTSAFLRLWTLKEAIAKRTGQGFETEFSEIDTSALHVVDGLEAARHHPKTDALLFHAPLRIDGKTVFLSVAAAPPADDLHRPIG